VKVLAEHIDRQLLAVAGRWEHCAVYEAELKRIWPMDEENRRAKLDQFAKEYGFRLTFYQPGLCAIFKKAKPPSS
jgi:hypothetical protein